MNRLGSLLNTLPQLARFAVESKASFLFLIIFWLLGEHNRNDKSERTTISWLDTTGSLPPRSFAGIEILKLTFTWIKYLCSGEIDASGRCDSEPQHGYLALHLDGYRSSAFYNIFTRKTALVVSAALLYAAQNYLTLIADHFVDRITLYIAFSFVTLFSVFAYFSLLGKSFSGLHWQAALLQTCGIFIIQSAANFSSSSESYPLLLCFILSRSSALILINHLYDTYPSINNINLHLFFSGLLIHGLMFLVEYLFSPFPDQPSGYNNSFNLLGILCQAGVDLASLAIIHDYDAVIEGLVRSFSAAFFVFYTCAFLNTKAVMGSCIVFAGALAYQVSNGKHLEKPHHTIRIAIGVLVTATIFLYAANSELRLPSSPQRAESVHELLSTPEILCTRNPRPPSHIADDDRVYHEFDNVLLIVFFSHARYDANLDFYRLTYEEFFPNIVFIGPASREDQGFDHSYDVLVDSYQSDEDLNSDPNYYKMAGRMAHHMLYTAMKEHPCYKGYLWAPFDTLLNLPRLQQFDKSRVWYHSPFAEYLQNPTLGDQYHNASRHAPPANISPDPAGNYSETWRGWGPDWWWGDPHVGLKSCMPAFEKVPAYMRAHLASLTNGTRFIGGSADTVYLPGRYYSDFMHVLGIFLETDCFLEIATPTALHLVVPAADEIQFLDHWWIWDPPFNATFVRQKWEEGFEVDTFHTFHWGDKTEHGVWRANPANVADVRKLLLESAERQGVDLPHLDWEVESFPL